MKRQIPTMRADPDVAALSPAGLRELDLATEDLAAGRQQQTLARVNLVLAEHPGHPRAIALLGQIAVCLGQPAAGLAMLHKAVAFDPSQQHRIWLALCLEKLGRRDEALGALAACAGTVPRTPEALMAIAVALYALGQARDAGRLLAGRIAHGTARAEAHYCCARLLQAAGWGAAAVEAYAAAVQAGGGQGHYFADLSSALSDLGRFEEACLAARIATELDPASSVGFNNLGHALLNLNRSAEALAAYEAAIALRADYAKAHFGYAVALLKCGDFARGWRAYEWRWRDCQTTRDDLAVPVWRGEKLDGQTILLHAEQGFGDTLQFVRFAPLVAARGARVVLQAPAALVRLMRTVAGVAEVIACGDPLPPIDWHCPMASLPLAFDVRVWTIPDPPFARRPAAQHDAPPARRDLVVGLVWAGDPRRADLRSNLIDRRRSTSLESLAPLFGIAGVRFVSFQSGEAREQLSGSQWPIEDAMKGVGDFADTAGRLDGIDLLVSVDTSMVHLAGGFGKPVWMLSRFDGCWRWLEGRDDTPWYPTLRIFRQPAPGDWPSVVAAVADALRGVVQAREGSGYLESSALVRADRADSCMA